MIVSGKKLLAAGLMSAAFLASQGVLAESKPVGITPDLMSVTISHGGQAVEIKRNQDNGATVNPDFAKTSRPCPPFCIQPMVLAPGVETLGEVEVLDYIAKMEAGDDSIILIDSRTPDWVAKGTIPGAKNISWVELTPAKGATTEGIIKVMTGDFNVKMADGVDAFAVDEAIAGGTAGEAFDYSNAKTLVLFCNGMWCGQSPESIKTLMKFGYPVEKIKWYRDGMQSWEILGLTTVKP
ncbi:MAG: rhodanese-like domain-containing protein [Gammaproteobacteria bacterium]|nr:rhodanese-like domain-containing protein [Gammaproteobacteria bacterium]